jgi:uncharacterized damage-inducible protein DinB
MPKSPKQQLRQVLEQEHDRTMRVLRAYPDDQSDFKPNERSRPAREVAWPLAIGHGRMILKALTTGFDWSQPSGGPPPPPAKMSEIAAAAEKAYRDVMEALEAADDDRLDKSHKFLVGPKTFGEMTTMEIVRFMLFDHIHHRGQLSVYLRMVGGKVPAIYGPSGDEPWR